MKTNIRKKIRLLLLICFALFLFWVNPFKLSRINGVSMENSLFSKDIILIQLFKADNKGLPSLFKANEVNKNEICVFNLNGHQYVKRFVGMPKDTVDMRMNNFYINGTSVYDLENIKVKYQISGNHRIIEKLLDSLNVKYERRVIDNNISIQNVSSSDVGKVSYIFPSDSIIPINGKNNYYAIVPYCGYKINLNDSTYNIYKYVLEKYENIRIQRNGGDFFYDNEKIEYYAFTKNYYFVIGDNLYSSIDSRSLGFIPEACILGKYKFRLLKRGKNDKK